MRGALPSVVVMALSAASVAHAFDTVVPSCPESVAAVVKSVSAKWSVLTVDCTESHLPLRAWTFVARRLSASENERGDTRSFDVIRGSVLDGATTATNVSAEPLDDTDERDDTLEAIEARDLDGDGVDELVETHEYDHRYHSNTRLVIRRLGPAGWVEVSTVTTACSNADGSVWFGRGPAFDVSYTVNASFEPSSPGKRAFLLLRGGFLARGRRVTAAALTTFREGLCAGAPLLVGDHRIDALAAP
ncbi:MAG: hypothetical protein ABI321_23405 [Polyangia bacterium]